MERKKIDNVSYADILEILKIKKAFNVKQCGNILEFKPTDEGYLKLHKTWFVNQNYVRFVIGDVL